MLLIKRRKGRYPFCVLVVSSREKCLCNHLVRDLTGDKTVDRVFQRIQIRLTRFGCNGTFKSRDRSGISLSIDVTLQLGLGSCELLIRSSISDTVACERGCLIGLILDRIRHVRFGRISREVDSRVTDEFPRAVDVHVLIVHVLTGTRRRLEDHVDRSLTDVLSRELGYNRALQKTCRRDLGLDKRIKVQNVRCERLRIQNIASLIFKSDIKISHYMIPLVRLSNTQHLQQR